MASDRKGFAQIIALAAFVLIALGAVAFWYFSSRAKPASVAQAPAPAPAPAPTPAPIDPAAQASLGGTIYAQSQNPIQGKVPTADPTVNPIQGVYKNPFE